MGAVDDVQPSTSVSEQIHDDEPDTSEPVVRALLAAECAEWADRPLEYIASSGTSNAMWRLRSTDDDTDLCVRLPRRPEAAAGVDYEVAVLRSIGRSAVAAVVDTPVVRHLGQPHERFPHRWSVLEWIDGVDAWQAREALAEASLDRLTEDLARLVEVIGGVVDIDAQPRPEGSRGGPLRPLLARLDRWLHDPVWNASWVWLVSGLGRGARRGGARCGGGGGRGRICVGSRW